MDADQFDMGKSCHTVYYAYTVQYIVFVFNDYSQNTETFIDNKTQLRLFILLKLVKFDKSLT